jgi:hypothetical protein
VGSGLVMVSLLGTDRDWASDVPDVFAHAGHSGIVLLLYLLVKELRARLSRCVSRAEIVSYLMSYTSLSPNAQTRDSLRRRWIKACRSLSASLGTQQTDKVISVYRSFRGRKSVLQRADSSAPMSERVKVANQGIEAGVT